MQHLVHPGRLEALIPGLTVREGHINSPIHPAPPTGQKINSSRDVKAANLYFLKKAAVCVFEKNIYNNYKLQRYSVYCHRGVKKQENIHILMAGITEF